MGVVSMQARPTLSQVADAAGVSVASASRVLSGLSASPAMAAKVQQAADQLGYVVDVTARSLKVRRTEQLALAVADLGNPVYVTMMRAIESVVSAAGYRLVVMATGTDADAEIETIRGMSRGYADGLIISPLRITTAVTDELLAARVPVVVIGSLPPKVHLDNVRANSVRGVGLAYSHLVEGGRRSIGFLNGPVGTTPGDARLKGFRRAAAANGRNGTDLAIDSAADFTADAGEKAAHRLLDKFNADALICANDLLAIGAMRALRERNRSVPDDTAVVGMDNTELAELMTPTLTSVCLGSSDRGMHSANLLLDRISDPMREPTRVTVQPRLVARDSTRRRTR
jgi:LacI family transcriptional regulator, galactose operon repressor